MERCPFVSWGRFGGRADDESSEDEEFEYDLAKGKVRVSDAFKHYPNSRLTIINSGISDMSPRTPCQVRHECVFSKMAL